MNQQDKIGFTAYLQAKNMIENTIARYIIQVEEFETWLQTNKEKMVDSTEKKDVLDYMLFIQNLSGSTRQHKLGILSHYYTFLAQEEQISSNPTRGIKLRGTRKKILPQVLTLDEMEQLLDTHFVMKVQHAETRQREHKGLFISHKYTHQRNHLVLSFSIYQGLNRSEWQALTLSDIDLQKATINIKEQRQTNARTLPLHATQIGIIYAYLNESRPHYNLDNETFLNPKFQLAKLATELREIYPKFKDFTQLRASIITHWIKTEGLRKAQYKAGLAT